MTYFVINYFLIFRFSGLLKYHHHIIGMLYGK